MNYTTFGSPMPTRTWSDPNAKYKYGFNGKEKDSEGLGGGGFTYDYGFRIYNSNLGKFLSVDPLFPSFPWYTPYQFAGNCPIPSIDLDGLEQYVVTKKYTLTSDGINISAEIQFKVKNRQPGQSGETDINRLGTIIYWIGRIIKKTVNVNQFSSFSWEYALINKKDFRYYETELDAISGTNSKTGSLSEATGKWKMDPGDDVPSILRQVTSDWQLKNFSVEHSTNKADSKQENSEYSKLDEVANALLANPLITVEINSYCSKKGSNQKELSQQRADQMKAKIISFAKAKGATDQEITDITSRITAIGKGVPEASQNKAADNDDQSDRKTNIIYGVQN